MSIVWNKEAGDSLELHISAMLLAHNLPQKESHNYEYEKNLKSYGENNIVGAIFS